MIIKLEDINFGNKGYLFVGTRSRMATATSIRFLNSERFVACNLAGQRMYLMRFDVARDTHEILSCIPTQYNGADVCTDLMDFDGNDRIVTSNCGAGSGSLYRVKGDELRYEKDVPIHDTSAVFCHGARFVPGAPETVCLTCVRKRRRVFFISTVTNEIIYSFDIDKWKPHDVCFLDSRRMIVVCELGTPSKELAPHYEAKAVIVSFDLARKTHAVCGELVFPEAHADSCEVFNDRVYVNNQMRDTVMVCRVEGDRLAFERELTGFSFPHGLAVQPDLDLLAVTNYGNNTIAITPLSVPVGDTLRVDRADSLAV